MATLAIDIDEFEDMILDGKFGSRIEACRWAREQAGWSGKRWSGSRRWQNIKAAMMPEVRDIYNALPQGREIYDNHTFTWTAVEALRTGSCKNGHSVNGLEDLGPNGKGKLSCLKCRKSRSARRHAGPPRARWTPEEDALVLAYKPVPGRTRYAINVRRSRLKHGRRV
jgi:hypothetical protein